MMMKSEMFTYQEILDQFTLAPDYPNQASVSSRWFTSLLASLSLTYQKYALSADFTDASIREVVNSLMTNVYDRHANDIILIIDSPICNPDHQLTIEDARKAISKLINVLNLTLPRYLPLLKQYKEVSTNPIAPIKSESKGETRFNDTPQNIGDWGDEEHTTNISNSVSESSIDTGSLMERLSAQYKDYKSIILEWSNEFNRCFLKEEQIDG